ncbi:histone deacetylase complex protein [Collybia nuda]|uniref:Histone deacetylase 8 n=1 Tax=Collybia nuda TaxID=64659 RepID=A0A9P5Y0S0_9AGAR|nr:histone deacetylase complex protein [Collybia nuda]
MDIPPTTSSGTKPIVAYIASQELAKVSSLLPSNKRRSMMVHSLVSSMGLMSTEFSSTKRIQIINPTRATYKELALYHDRDYLDFVLDPVNSSNLGGDGGFGLEDDCPPFPQLHDYVPLVAGATLTAANVLVKNISDVAISWDGGRHHAQKSHAAGFCYVADCILAIMALKRSPPILSSLGDITTVQRKPKIMYLDLDLHFSDAVSEAFSFQNQSGTPQILTMSIHHTAPGFFPISPFSQLPDISNTSFDPFTLALPLMQGASDGTFSRIWSIVENVKDAFEPDYIIIQCGVDSLAGDPCAIFNWSLHSLGWCINRVLNQWQGKKLLLGGGGYNSPNVARAWTYLTSIALNNPLNLEAEIPDHSGFPLYEPSFTLDVPAGNMQDQNTEAYLQSVESCFENIIELIKKRLNA